MSIRRDHLRICGVAAAVSLAAAFLAGCGADTLLPPPGAATLSTNVTVGGTTATFNPGPAPVVPANTPALPQITQSTGTITQGKTVQFTATVPAGTTSLLISIPGQAGYLSIPVPAGQTSLSVNYTIPANVPSGSETLQFTALQGNNVIGSSLQTFTVAQSGSAGS